METQEWHQGASLNGIDEGLSLKHVLRVGNRTSDARYNRTPLLGICVRHLSDNATGLKDRYHSRWVSIFIGVYTSLAVVFIVR